MAAAKVRGKVARALWMAAAIAEVTGCIEADADSALVQGGAGSAPNDVALDASAEAAAPPAAVDASVQDAASAALDAGLPSGLPRWGYENGGCRTGEQAELALDEPTPWGISGHDVVDFFDERATGTLTWADGSTSRVAFTASPLFETSAYDAFDEYQGFCEPTLWVDVTFSVSTEDGRLVATSVWDTRTRTTLIAETDGDGAIDVVFPLYYPVELADIDHPSVEAAEAVHPDYEGGRAGISLSVSDRGVSALCGEDAVLSDDPNEICNAYGGVLRYYAESVDYEPVHGGGDTFRTALAWWTWD